MHREKLRPVMQVEHLRGGPSGVGGSGFESLVPHWPATVIRVLSLAWRAGAMSLGRALFGQVEGAFQVNERLPVIPAES